MNKAPINDIKRGPLGNCIVLHDFPPVNSSTIKDLFEYSVRFFEEKGITPTKVGLGGKSPAAKGKSNILFKTAKRRLEETHYEGIDGLWIGAMPPIYSQEVLDALFCVDLDVRESKKNHTMVLCFDDQIVSFQKDHLEQLCTDLASFLKPRYGYGYQREFKKGPTWYPFGVCVGLGWDDPEADLLTEWAKKYHTNNRYQTGDLRDIYPMNLLSEAHKNHVVDGKPFFEWICEDPQRGRLTSLTEDLWTWWIESDSIAMIRESLGSTGWVISI